MRRLSHTKNFSWGAARWLGAVFFQEVSGIGRYQLKYFSHFFRRRVGQEDINCSFFLHFLGGGWDRQISIAGFFSSFSFQGEVGQEDINCRGYMAPQCTAKWDASDFSPVCNCVCTRMGSDIGRDQLLPLESHRNAFFSSVAYHWVHFTGTEILRYYIYLKVKIEIGHNRFALKGQGAG